MPQAVPQPVREEIVRRRQAGERLTHIAAALQMSYRTVRGLWRRFRQRGPAGLAPDYAQCGPQRPHFDRSLQEVALALKRDHPSWGAGMIRVQLAQQFPDVPLPRPRTLQAWFRSAGLHRSRARKPPVAKQRGKVAHAVWQLDAKEQIRLADGSRSVAFCLVDEATGAALGAALFPPGQGQPGAGGPGAGVAAGDVRSLGAAPESAGG